MEVCFFAGTAAAFFMVMAGRRGDKRREEEEEEEDGDSQSRTAGADWEELFLGRLQESPKEAGQAVGDPETVVETGETRGRKAAREEVSLSVFRLIACSSRFGVVSLSREPAGTSADKSVNLLLPSAAKAENRTKRSGTEGRQCRSTEESGSSSFSVPLHFAVPSGALSSSALFFRARPPPAAPPACLLRAVRMERGQMLEPKETAKALSATSSGYYSDHVDQNEQVRLLNRLANAEGSSQVKQDAVLANPPDWKTLEKAGVLPAGLSAVLSKINPLCLDEFAEMLAADPDLVRALVALVRLEGNLHTVQYVLTVLCEVVRGETRRGNSPRKNFRFAKHTPRLYVTVASIYKRMYIYLQITYM
nr:hypothetical protein TgIb.1030 [Toxoplasma gondii RH]